MLSFKKIIYAVFFLISACGFSPLFIDQNSANLAGQVSIHSSHTYHSSGANLDETPRVGMVVHFCTDRAIRQLVTGSNSAYLDQLKDGSISPFIFGGDP